MALTAYCMLNFYRPTGLKSRAMCHTGPSVSNQWEENTEGVLCQNVFTHCWWIVYRLDWWPHATRCVHQCATPQNSSFCNLPLICQVALRRTRQRCRTTKVRLRDKGKKRRWAERSNLLFPPGCWIQNEALMDEREKLGPWLLGNEPV